MGGPSRIEYLERVPLHASAGFISMLSQSCIKTEAIIMDAVTASAVTRKDEMRHLKVELRPTRAAPRTPRPVRAARLQALLAELQHKQADGSAAEDRRTSLDQDNSVLHGGGL